MTRALLVAAAAVPALVAVVAAAVVGWHLGSRPDGSAAREPARTARVGPATMTVPPDWHPVPLARSGLELGDRVDASAFDVAPGLPARAVVLVAPPADATLLPAPLRAAGPRVRPRPVNLAGHPAWRYAAPAVPAGPVVEVTVLPTSAAVLAVACVAPSFASAAASGCALGIDGLQLDGGRVLAPDAGTALRLNLPATLAELRARRTPQRRVLARARTAAGQARASRALADAFGGAAERLSPFAAARDQRSLIAALRSAAGAYRRLAAAAADGRPDAYARARADVARAERAVEASVRRAGATPPADRRTRGPA